MTTKANEIRGGGGVKPTLSDDKEERGKIREKNTKTGNTQGFSREDHSLKVNPMG